MSQRDAVGRREQVSAITRVVRYRPTFTIGILVASVLAATLEAIGLTFILPLIELVQSSGDPVSESEGIMSAFVFIYQTIGIQISLRSVIIGVSLVLAVRWTLTFIVRWLRGALEVDYIREMQTQSFDNALGARIKYFDQEGSDDILNAIVTQSEYAGRVIRRGVNLFEQGFMTIVYLLLAFYLAPWLTVFALVFLGGFSFLFRYCLESGYDLGNRVADVNERVQQIAQAGTQGIRDTKLFNLENELLDEFSDATDEFSSVSARQWRNREAIKSFYNLLTAVSVFLLIYLAITIAEMSLSSLGVFLFAMFRLGPKASNLNSILYRLENELPHLVRTHSFIDDLEQNNEQRTKSEPVPDRVRSVVFDDVWYSYEGQDEAALSGISFSVERGEFIGFVGQSGAGKSTIVSLLARLYEPDSGKIRANDNLIHEMDINDWRRQVAVVRQDPFIFNDTLRYNLTIGNREVTEEELDEVCHIAKVDEFLDELPKEYDTDLGDEGVRLSGGQRQRVALARALLKDADILMLDEATSDLDSNLERQVQAAIEEMDRDYAIISIAHRLSTVKNADRIYTVSNGEIIETGNHEELVNSDGKYAEMYGIQSYDA